MELARKLAQQPEAILQWFEKLCAIIQRLGILAEDMWNMDETGCRIGVAKNQYVYTKHGKTVFIPHSNNRELMTLVEACSANGEIIDPMIIIKASTILERWVMDLPDDYLIHKSDSGYSNDETSLDWIKHFNKMTKHKTKGTWRLLILDGYGSHHTREFIRYAARNRIQLFALPPHTTHFLQVLDVGCFQPLKWYHSRTLDWAARTGSKEITKATIHAIRMETFKPGIIRSGWRRTGIHPFNPEAVAKKLR
ncbi:DDE-domain-containing protein, partial [Zopfia rhizophila CBS 207.26]